MITAFQTFAHSFYSGWALFIALAYTFGAYSFLVGKLGELKQWRLLQIASAICLITSAYLIIIGVYQAIDWVNPFAGKGAEVASTVHSPKGGLIILLIVVWPYALVLVGLAVGHIAQREFRATTKLLRLLAKKA
ncbi:hypothetical protein ACC739_30125 [Rhizobium ruizarguesonis]